MYSFCSEGYTGDIDSHMERLIREFQSEPAEFREHEARWKMTGTGAAAGRLSPPDAAYAFLNKSLNIDLEDGTAEGIHIANCGGIWQAVMMGMAGFRGMEQGTPCVRPVLAQHIRSLSSKIAYQGNWYRITVAHKGVSITNIQEEQRC